MNAREVARRFEARLRTEGDPERAASERRYLKSDLTFIGARMAQIEAALRASVPAKPGIGHDDLVALAEALWEPEVFERRLAVAKLLSWCARALEPDDLPIVERLVRESRTWALVDPLATGALGELVRREAPTVSQELDRWATDADFWVRRASLLAELRPIRAGAPLTRFLARADAMLDEREFFIRKAIGWVLRETGRRRPADVVAWLGPRTHRASGVTMREAIKYLPPADAERLMTAYRERRPAA